MKLRIALVVSHPIQHFCPQYVSFSKNKDIDFKVFFASKLGYEKYIDRDFGTEISWGNLELDQFNHQFLNGDKLIQPDRNIDAISLDSALDSFMPQLVISYGYFQLLQRRAHKWAIRNKIPIAYISDSERIHHRNIAKDVMKFPYIFWYFSKINYFLSVGNANESFYRYYGVAKEKILRMHFPIDIKYYAECYEKREYLRESIRRKYEISQSELVFCVVGKLVPWKNQDHVIDAMLNLEKDGIFCNLFILGSGKELENWRRKAQSLKKSKVFFPGFVNIEDLPSFYAATDVYIHPASIEPHSIAISEAIYMGCPIILSNRCGSYGESDDVQVGENGLVYNFGDIYELSKIMKWMIMNANERKMMGLRSHQLSIQFQNRSHFLVLDELIDCLNKQTVKK